MSDDFYGRFIQGKKRVEGIDGKEEFTVLFEGVDYVVAIEDIVELSNSLFLESPANTITTEDIDNWDEAFGWGDHSTAGYLTSEVNDLSSSVTWVNIPDANITESSILQHESALSILESQITNLQDYLLDAPSDGSIYGRQDGAWELIVGGDDNYVDELVFNTFDGVLTLGRTGALADLTQSLDGRYLLDAPSDGNIYGRKDGSWETTGGGTTVTSVNTETGDVVFTSGSGLDLTGTEYSHTNTSEVGDTTNTNEEVISNLTFDTFGHVITADNLDLSTLYYNKTESDTRFFPQGNEIVLKYLDAGDFIWICPLGVTSVKLEGYGSGAQGDQLDGIWGGCGGAYSVVNNYTAIPGTTYYIRVAAVSTGYSGNDSLVSTSASFTENIILKAVGGTGKNGNDSGCIGDTSYAGGNGGSMDSYYKGAGGGAAGPSGDGTDAVVGSPGYGNGGIAGDGAGGILITVGANVVGTKGYSPGGGGGASLGTADPGNGAKGAVILTYTV